MYDQSRDLNAFHCGEQYVPDAADLARKHRAEREARERARRERWQAHHATERVA